MDRLDHISPELESKEPSPGNSRASFFFLEGPALAVPRPSCLTRSLFRCDRRCDCGAVIIAAGVKLTKTWLLLLPLSSAGPDLSISTCPMQGCMEGARFCSRGATRSRACERDSEESEEAIAAPTSERDEQKFENGKLRDEVERLREEKELAGHQSQTIEREREAKTRDKERHKQELKKREEREIIYLRGVDELRLSTDDKLHTHSSGPLKAGEEEVKRLAAANGKLRAEADRQKIQIRNLQAGTEALGRCKAERVQLKIDCETLAVIDTFRDEGKEWESRPLEFPDRKRKASSPSTPSFAAPTAEIETHQENVLTLRGPPVQISCCSLFVLDEVHNKEVIRVK
ncbi:hypothetical protein Efla_000874 [Eimeria flavescens]